MGMDSVEIVIGWEEVFGIVIPDQVAARIRTPRDATNFILTQVKSRPASECIRQQIFFRLRRGFRQACGALPDRFDLTTKLRTIVARRDWQQAWSTLRLFDHQRSWPLSAPFSGPIRFRLRTVADLVQELAMSDPRALHAAGAPWTREMVSLEVRRVVEEVMGAKSFDEDDDFVKDIGIA